MAVNPFEEKQMNREQMIACSVVGRVLADAATKTEVRVIVDGDDQACFSSKTDPSEAAQDVAANELSAFHADRWKIEVKGTEVHVTKK
jgi:hypothetical protein